MHEMVISYVSPLTGVPVHLHVYAVAERAETTSGLIAEVAPFPPVCAATHTGVLIHVPSVKVSVYVGLAAGVEPAVIVLTLAWSLLVLTVMLVEATVPHEALSVKLPATSVVPLSTLRRWAMAPPAACTVNLPVPLTNVSTRFPLNPLGALMPNMVPLVENVL